MLVYRITKTIYAQDLSGMGASIFGGRWNPKGLHLLYTAGSTSLATLEFLVHNIHLFKPEDISLVKIKIPDDTTIEEVSMTSLPTDWNEKTYLPQSTQEIGSDFIKNKNIHILKVPSAIVPDEYNFLLNPFHANHDKAKVIEIITPFEVDKRLF